MELSGTLDRNLQMERPHATPDQLMHWLHWPFWRFLGVLAMFGAIAYFQFGVRPPALRQLPLGFLTVIEVALALSLVSGILGGLVVNIYLLWPLALLTKANTWFFAFGEQVARRLIGGHRARLRWWLAYAIELALFLGLFYGGRFAFLRMGLRL